MRVSKRIKIALIMSLTLLTNTLLFIIKPDLLNWITTSPNPVVIVASEIIIHPLVWWIIIETALSIDVYFNRRIKWIEAPVKRLIIQTFVQIVTIILIDIAITVFFQTIIDTIGFAEYSDYYRKDYITLIQNLIVDVTVSIMIIVMNTINYLIVSLRKSANDAAALKISTAEYRQAAAEAELKALQMQIDPHFVFNNMSALSELILKDPKLGYAYSESFSKVYRYLLLNSNMESIKLEEELKFINAYIYMISYRVGTGVRFEIDIDKSLFLKRIPPMTLQILIENAQKHNKTLKSHPLLIRIYSRNERELVVENSIIPLDKQPMSSRMGLSNIINRYRLLIKTEPLIENNGSVFRVIIPLISKSNKL